MLSFHIHPLKLVRGHKSVLGGGRLYSVKPKEFTITSKMKAIKLRDTAFDLFNVGLRSVMPHTMVMNSLQLNGNILSVENQSYVLNNNVYIVAFGKAVIGMVKTAEDILGDHVVKGVASIPYGIQSAFKTLGKWLVNLSIIFQFFYKHSIFHLILKLCFIQFALTYEFSQPSQQGFSSFGVK